MIMHQKAKELGLIHEGDMTLAEELRFIHEHIEAIELQNELRFDAINEEFKALSVLLRQLLATFDRMVDAIESANGG